jgi:hypothetical protein
MPRRDGGKVRCPKKRQISKSKEEEVPLRKNFRIIRGNGALFRIAGKFPLQGNFSPRASEIYRIFWTV